MSAGSAPVRGALFALIVVHQGALSSSAGPNEAFRLEWLTDLGAEATSTPRAAGLLDRRPVAAQVAGAAYFLTTGEDGRLERQKRVSADYSIGYALAAVEEGAVVAGGDGSVDLWSWPADGEPPRRRWRRSIGTRVMSVGWDGGESVWVATRDDRLIALSTTDGEELWSKPLEGKAEGPAVREGGSIFVATKAGKLFHLDAGSGKTKWKVELPGPALHPPVLSGRDPRVVVSGTWNGHLAASDASTGKTLWSTELGARLAGAPAAGESFVAAATEDGLVHAFEISGAPRFRARGTASDATDLVVHRGAGGAERLIVVSNVLTVLDPATGASFADYPQGAVAEVTRRFLDAMLEGEKAYSETEKAAVLARETFPVQGRLFGEARLFGNRLVFTTEEGFIYSFDASSLRPLSRYRSGRHASSRPVLAERTLIAAASDEIFALDPDSGRTLWSRDVRAVREVVPGPKLLALVSEDRFDVLDPMSGARQWSASGEFQTVLAVGPTEGESQPSWLAVSRSGSVEALDAAGRRLGSSLDLAGEIAAVAAIEARSWAAATRDGRITSFQWEGAFRRGWEATLPGSIQSLSSSNERLLVAAGEKIIGIASSDGSPVWEISFEPGGTFHKESRAILVLDSRTIRVHDVASGELRDSHALSSPAVGATLRDGALIWLDTSGRAHRSGAVEDEPADLGIPLSRAIFASDRFLVTTEAGEVGSVELARAEPAAVVPP